MSTASGDLIAVFTVGGADIESVWIDACEKGHIYLTGYETEKFRHAKQRCPLCQVALLELRVRQLEGEP